MASLEELERKRAQLDAQIKAKRRQLSKEERKARNHALMVAGGLLVQHAPGGDWKRVDWDKLAAWVSRCGYKIAECEAPELPTKEAARRLRDWERRGRDASADRPDGDARPL